jgi:hypothetical protein
MTTVSVDVDALVADPIPLSLVSGFPIKVERLRTRATMALLKILTRGAGEALLTLRIGPDMDAEQFTGVLLGAVLVSIPEAEDETIEFINKMVSPANLHEGPRITPGDRAWNEEQEEILRGELEDPELDDLMVIVSEIVKNEAPHVLALGKQLVALLPIALRANKSDQTPDSPIDQTSAPTSTPRAPRKKAVASSESDSKG